VITTPDSSALPKVGVVIVNFNNYGDTIRYVGSCLIDQEMIDLSVVIVDNCSDNDSFARIGEAFINENRVFLIRNEQNTGYSGGNNTGIRYLETLGCDYIVISNNDVYFSDNLFIKKLIDEYEKLRDAAFIAPVMDKDGKPSGEHSAWKIPGRLKEIISSEYILNFTGRLCLKKFSYDLSGLNGQLIRVDCLAGSFFMGRTSEFRTAGYLDENVFLYYEETILGQKIAEQHKSNYVVTYLHYDHFQDRSVMTRYNRISKLRILFNSRLYYWKTYRRSGIIFLSILRILYFINLAETCIFRFRKVFIQER